MDTNELIAGVRAYARKHATETGWDIIANYYSDGMIEAVIARCKVLDCALRRVKAVVKVYVEEGEHQQAS